MVVILYASDTKRYTSRRTPELSNTALHMTQDAISKTFKLILELTSSASDLFESPNAHLIERGGPNKASHPSLGLGKRRASHRAIWCWWLAELLKFFSSSLQHSARMQKSTKRGPISRLLGINTHCTNSINMRWKTPRWPRLNIDIGNSRNWKWFDRRMFSDLRTCWDSRICKKTIGLVCCSAIFH